MKEINIYIKNKEDFFLKYDNSKISKELINYLIESTILNTKNKIIMHSSLDIDYKKYIIEGLEEELEHNLENKKRTNHLQILLIFLGMFFLCLSVIFKDFEIWHEVILIGGWVPIWEAIDIELFRDSKERKKRYILNNLLKSEIEVKKETK